MKTATLFCFRGAEAKAPEFLAQSNHLTSLHWDLEE